MERIKYGPGEFTGEFTEDRFGKAPVFHPPITVRENFEALFKGKQPLWMPLTTDSQTFCPRVGPDNIARAFVFDGETPYDRSKYGGPDMFGIEWVFVPVAGAKEFCEFFIRDGKCRTIANCMRKNPKFVAYVYQISRQMLNP